MRLNHAVNNISVVSCKPALLMEVTGVPRENGVLPQGSDIRYHIYRLYRTHLSLQCGNGTHYCITRHIPFLRLIREMRTGQQGERSFRSEPDSGGGGMFLRTVSNHTLIPLGYLSNFCFQAKNNYLVAFSKCLT